MAFGVADQSPATLVLAWSCIVVVFVAPYGIVGLLQRIGAQDRHRRSEPPGRDDDRRRSRHRLGDRRF